MIERILEKNKIPNEPAGSFLKIRCLSPDHEDKNPSMFVNKYTGWANCKSCGASYDLYKLFNETPDILQIKKNKFIEQLRKTAFDSNSLEIPEGAVFFRSSFRGISSKTIQKFQAFQTSEYPGYLFFPVRSTSGRIVNFIGRDTTGTRTPKYLFLHKVALPMAPNEGDRLGSVILVEGWIDALNLYDKGLTNVRALFGTDYPREKLVEQLKFEGISEVVIMMDGDAAGARAASEIRDVLEREYINVRVIKLPDGTDPGDMSQTSIDKLRSTLYG